MDIEQLKLILEAAKAAGDGAMEVVFVFFAYKFLGLFLKIGGSLYYTSEQTKFEKWLAKNYEEQS